MGIILKMCTMHMFGASVSVILINIERTVDLHVITKKEIHMRTQEL